MSSTKESLADQFRVQMAEWNAQIERLRAKARDALEEERAEINRHIEQLESKKEAAHAKYFELEILEEEAEAWHEMKTEMDQAWHDVKDAFKDAAHLFK